MTWWDNTPTQTTIIDVLNATQITVTSGTSSNYWSSVPKRDPVSELVDDFAAKCRARLEEIRIWSLAALEEARSLLFRQRLPALVFTDRSSARSGRSCSLSGRWRVRGPP